MLRRLMAFAVVSCIMLMLFGCTKKDDVNQESVPGVVENPWLDDATVETTEVKADSNNTEAEKTVDQHDKETVSSGDSDEENTQKELDDKADNTDSEETTSPVIEIVPTTEYEWYHALSGEEQQAYMESFESTAAFFEWYNAAKAEYEALHPSIEIDDGVIDLDDLLGGNG